MVCITGDIHSDPNRVLYFCQNTLVTENDTIIILGDVGANYYSNERDAAIKAELNSLGVEILCIHGNHEIRPSRISSYKLKTWNGGKVFVEDEYPNLLFCKDGEIYTIEGLRYIAIGGAYSVDKPLRILRNWGWWSDEQPGPEIKAFVENQLSKHTVDIVLSHTCPHKYIPVEMFLGSIDQSTVDSSTEEWLDEIEDRIEYKAWFCGHWHTNKRIDKIHFLFDSWESIENI